MTDVELINSLGGCVAVANILQIKPPSVSEWLKKNAIPEGRRIRLAVVAEDRGIAKRKDIFPKDYAEIWIELRDPKSKAAA